ncbi:hypothetical protein HEK616_40530 [Streptomyces nigrescens]|uniref:Uncharacterized protein n=1 Tax=Streptomyces nigrescens TaxID=1920 RepID=A0ABM7ZW38_STRNI|nr:hypothetical protein HEK616_40530 [Streptomyces nigrescens]
MEGARDEKAVRMAIAYDRGREQLMLFALDHTPGGPVYEAVPPESWAEMFAD